MSLYTNIYVNETQSYKLSKKEKNIKIGPIHRTLKHFKKHVINVEFILYPTFILTTPRQSTPNCHSVQ